MSECLGGLCRSFRSVSHDDAVQDTVFSLILQNTILYTIYYRVPRVHLMSLYTVYYMVSHVYYLRHATATTLKSRHKVGHINKKRAA